MVTNVRTRRAPFLTTSARSYWEVTLKFILTPTREGKGPQTFLSKYEGWLQCDQYYGHVVAHLNKFQNRSSAEARPFQERRRTNQNWNHIKWISFLACPPSRWIGQASADERFWNLEFERYLRDQPGFDRKINHTVMKVVDKTKVSLSGVCFLYNISLICLCVYTSIYTQKVEFYGYCLCVWNNNHA